MKKLLLGFLLLMLVQPVLSQTQWQTVSIPNHSGPVTGVDFINNQTGFVGYDYLWKTTDGGSTWYQVLQFPYNQNIIKGIRFFNEQVGIMTGLWGKILKTIDGGQNWVDISIPSPSNNHFVEVHFFSSDHFILTGRGSAMTTNGGLTWTQYSLGALESFYGLAFSNEQKGIAGYFGAGSYLITSNGGANWSIQTLLIEGKNLEVPYAVKTPDGILLVGRVYDPGIQKIILGVAKTTNEGNSWSSQLFPIHIGGVIQVIFKEEKGYALCVDPFDIQKSVILTTSDGGASWEQRWSVPMYVPRMCITDNRIYLLRNNGTVMFTDINVGIQNISSETPEGYELSQNYPNPFNPSTNIRFDIQKLGLVTLKVYDVLGKEVATLVNESLSPGTYNYQFSTDNYQLTSGVYFYKLESDEFSDVKRMLLIK